MNLTVEYVKNGINKIEAVSSSEEAEKFITENNLVEVDIPENENECRITG
jgi:hypothetical protein